MTAETKSAWRKEWKRDQDVLGLQGEPDFLDDPLWDDCWDFAVGLGLSRMATYSAARRLLEFANRLVSKEPSHEHSRRDT